MARFRNIDLLWTILDLPQHLSHEEAAALPSWLTAWRALMTRGRLCAG